MTKTTNKRKTSVGQKLLSAVKPGSVKSGALLFMLAFAVIGGSYMLFRSYAATEIVKQAWADNAPNLIKLSSGSAVKQTDPVGGAPSTKAWRLKRNAIVYAEYNYPSKTPPSNIKFCVYSRFPLVNPRNEFLIYGWLKFQAGSKKYQEQCYRPTKFLIKNGNRIGFEVQNYGPGDMFILYMAFKYTL
ncbi:MAG TPA: hypothetical protein VLF39_00645 [Candidatus Saccharimonadales bacterium]|nr:hypothetical protein [Candidatus Saccharimonadales bacterium]